MARGRGAASPQDKEASLLISKKLKELLKETGKKQVELSRETGIPASTLTGYIKGTANIIIGKNYGAYGIETYMACMLIYWVMILLLEQGFHQLERRQARWS